VRTAPHASDTRRAPERESALSLFLPYRWYIIISCWAVGRGTKPPARLYAATASLRSSSRDTIRVTLTYPLSSRRKISVSSGVSGCTKKENGCARERETHRERETSARCRMLAGKQR
jgi:hypothetical protein